MDNVPLVASVRREVGKALATAIGYEALTNPMCQEPSDVSTDTVEIEMVTNSSVENHLSPLSQGSPDMAIDWNHTAERPKHQLHRALRPVLILLLVAAIAAVSTVAYRVEVPLGHLRPSYATIIPVNRLTASGDYRPDILLLVVDDLRIDDSRLPCYAPTMNELATRGVTFSLANRYMGQITYITR